MNFCIKISCSVEFLRTVLGLSGISWGMIFSTFVKLWSYELERLVTWAGDMVLNIQCYIITVTGSYRDTGSLFTHPDKPHTLLINYHFSETVFFTLGLHIQIP